VGRARRRAWEVHAPVNGGGCDGALDDQRDRLLALADRLGVRGQVHSALYVSGALADATAASGPAAEFSPAWAESLVLIARINGHARIVKVLAGAVEHVADAPGLATRVITDLDRAVAATPSVLERQLAGAPVVVEDLDADLAALVVALDRALASLERAVG
jgi:hypothetical protein